MKKIIVLFFLISNISAFSQGKVGLISFSDLDKKFNQKNDTTYIYNFWATWCGPCVKELPDFESINTEGKDKKIKVVFVSLDFANELESKVQMFINNKKVKSLVYLLNETDSNSYIDKVSENWSGTIPATLIINSEKNKRIFLEKPLTKLELTKLTNF